MTGVCNPGEELLPLSPEVSKGASRPAASNGAPSAQGHWRLHGTLGTTVNTATAMGNRAVGLKKFQVDYCAVYPTFGYISKRIKSRVLELHLHPMFIAALFAISKM